MDDWLTRQKSKAPPSQGASLAEQVASSVASQVASQVATPEQVASSVVSQVASQVAEQVAEQVASPSAFSQDAWLARQGEEDETFRQAEWTPAASWEADDDLEQSLLSDIEEGLGKKERGMMEGRIVTIEESMRPMFQALPKNEYGKLGHSSVRYMLHRFFVAEHGWFIDGLYSEGAALNTSSPSGALKDRVPMFVQGLFEKRLGGRGFGIHEMAVLVAVVENSVHQEAQTALKMTYKALDLSVYNGFDAEQANTFIQIYMSGFVMNTNMSAVSGRYLYRQAGSMTSMYPTWPRARTFFHKVIESHALNDAHGKTAPVFSFTAISAIVKELVDTFGTFHGQQCQGLKSTLMDLERKGSSGCVNLPDFYAKGLKADTNWLFVETPEFLRHIGVLDESDPKNPHLLSANYITSPTNCLQPTGYYLVCCHNECDDILGQLEKQLGMPAATPTEIVKALQGSQASLRSGRLAPSLRRRLQEVADYHDGRVPIHGRLFAQWLHHVYPHECPYPHMSGSKHPQWVQDFEEETGKFVQMTEEEMASFVANASKTVAPKANKTLSADAGSCAPWRQEEELFASIPHARLPLHELENDPHLWNVTGGIAFIAAAATFFIAIMRTCRSMTKLQHQPKMLQV